MTDFRSAEDRSPFPREIEGGGVMLTLTPDQLYVRFAETPPPQELDAFFGQFRLQPVPEEHGSVPRGDLDEVTIGQRWLGRARMVQMSSA